MSLEKFLGLFTGSDPASLPEGGSPLCFNCDFQVSGVLPRPGTQSVFLLVAESFAGNAFDGGGSFPWSNPFSATGPPSGIYAVRGLSHGQISDPLETTNYNFSLSPTDSVQSINVSVTGGVGGSGFPGLTLSASLIYQGAIIAGIFPNIFIFPNGTTDQTFNFSVSNQSLGNILTPTVVNDPSFGVQFTVSYSGSIGVTRSVRLSGAQIGIILNSGLGRSFNYLKTFEQTDGDVTTLALDSLGTIWQEDAINNPGQLTSVSAPSLQQTISAYASAGADTGVGGFPSIFPWTNPGNIAGPPDGNYATNNLGNGASTGSSNTLIASNYGFALPPGATILDLTIVLTGHFAFNVTGPTIPQLSFALASQGAQIGSAQEVNFNSTADTQISFGGLPSSAWATALSTAVINDPSFGVIIGGVIQSNRPHFPPPPQTTGTFEIDSAQIIITYMTGGRQQIQPNSFAQSVTLDDREFMAFSNLLSGTDIPRTFDPTQFNRLSQVGPGAPPSASITTTGSNIVSITQNPAVPLLVGAHDFLLVSDSPSDQGSFGTPATPGNVMTLVFRSATLVPSYLKPGSNIVLSGFPAINGFRVNNDPTGALAPPFYTVTAVGQPIPGQQSYDAIVFTVNFTTFYNKPTLAGCVFQATEATLTTATQVPNLEVGNQFQIASTGGAPPTGYDGTWLVDATPNASQLQIVSTALTNNIATYGFNLITGTAPVAGEAVTILGTFNGNGLFNVANAIILSVSAGTFSIALQSANVPSAAEDGGGLIFGTIFQFDPFAVVGNKTGGTIVTQGIIAAGIRKICYSFLTDTGYLTQPSPIFTLDVVSGAQSIAVSNLLTGPSNVVARVVHLTGANGGNFYNIPVPVTVLSNGQKVVNTSTYLMDNTSTSITLSFSDDVLTSATSIDISGNNLFETGELGAPIALIPYAGRLAAIGEQNKVQNLLNYSFDGGIEIIRGNTLNQTYPAGWTPSILSSVTSSPALDGVTTGQVNASPSLPLSVTPTTPHDWALLLCQSDQSIGQPAVVAVTDLAGGTWTNLVSASNGALVSSILNSAATLNALANLAHSTNWVGALFLIPIKPSAIPGVVQSRTTVIFFSSPFSFQFGTNTVPGNGILVFLFAQLQSAGTINATVTDSQGNIGTQVASVQNPTGSLGGEYIGAWYFPNIIGGVRNTMTFTWSGPPLNGQFTIQELTGLALPVVSTGIFGGSVVTSPIFGDAYQIIGTGSPTSPSGNVGMITQPSFQDEFEVPIIDASTTYSVRITAEGSAAGTPTIGNLVVDLFSPSVGRALGTFSLPLQNLTTNMAIYTGTLLTTMLAPVPSDLILRVYLNGLQTTWQVLIDRLEVFPTEQPNLTGQIILSYQDNFEAFDRVEGVVRTDVQNQQPNKSAFTLFDTLYVVKTNSLVSTQDNETTQPSEWSEPRVISNVVGTASIYGVAGISDQDSGEEWAIIAGQPGAFVFNGGEPIKITEEIQELWDLINWKYGHTLWVTNDIKSHRILIGVPIKTFTLDTKGNRVQNPWIPSGLIPDNGNPTTPNAIIALNYRFLTTANALADRPSIHVSSFGGKLLSVDMARKWNIWSIQSPCAAFIKRSDATAPTMFGNSAGTGKIYQLTPGLLEDDGAAFWQLWTSHGFPTPEQEQGLQLGAVRKVYEYMSDILDGTGELTINVMPDSLDSPYAHALLPNLILPATTSGDVELPINEVGNRLFLQFSCDAVGAGFTLSRIVMMMREDPWAAVRGVNT